MRQLQHAQVQPAEEASRPSNRSDNLEDGKHGVCPSSKIDAAGGSASPAACEMPVDQRRHVRRKAVQRSRAERTITDASISGSASDATKARMASFGLRGRRKRRR